MRVVEARNREELNELLDMLFDSKDNLEEPGNNYPEELQAEILYNQLAEESAELIQSIMKMKRLYGENPTPKTEEECWNDFKEEMADVLLCLTIISDKLDIEEELDKIAIKKYDRWVDRLNEGTD